MRSVIIHTLAFLAALGPTLLIVGKLIIAVGAMIKVFSLLLTPTGLLAVAIIALAAAAIYVATHWEAVSLRLMLAWTARCRKRSTAPSKASWRASPRSLKAGRTYPRP
jgi:hypothetical protein